VAIKNGHASPIWVVRFLENKDNELGLRLRERAEKAACRSKDPHRMYVGVGRPFSAIGTRTLPDTFNPVMALFFSCSISDLFRHARRSRRPGSNGDMEGHLPVPISHTRIGTRLTPGESGRNSFGRPFEPKHRHVRVTVLPDVMDSQVNHQSNRSGRWSVRPTVCFPKE